MFSLEGQNALITGASRGLGLAIAETLAEAGCNVHLVARSAEAVEREAARLAAAHGVKARGWAADVADAGAVAALFDAAVKEWGSLEILVNNAGITRDTLLMRMKDEDFDAVLATNLKSAFLCTRAVLRPMLKQKYGRILNMSSIVGIRGQAGQANYAASKAGLIGFSKSCAREVASRSITCNVIAPGFIDSDMTRALSAEQREAILKDIPSGRMGEAREVAALALFLASRESAYITGQVFSIDGGMGI